MNKKLNINLFRLVSLVLTLLLLGAVPVWSAPQKAGDTSHRFSDKKDAYKGAFEKTGFYNGIEDERVTILDETSYKKLSYIVANDMIITYQGQVLEQKTLLPHSIVKLIIVDAEVVEIVLIQESS